ncbi:hypothetical protein LCGC14_2306470 [marine sediment metagenome]|uniref:Uncharacterized protein n=1 Tax=marine sediment metagenome TaxID=412755 RepID=A0A0F9D9F0_9ZZZZ
MHIIPADMPGANIDAIVRKNVCGECGRKVAAFLNPITKERYIACSSTQHDEAPIVKEWIAPKGEDTTNQERQRRIDMTSEAHGQEVSTALAAQGLPMSGTLTEAQATTVLKTIWRDAPEIEIWKAAKICQDFGLHPLLKHLYLIKYGSTWTMVLGIGATRLMMARRGAFGYTDNTPRIMTDEEQKAIFGTVDKENIVAITKLRTATGLEAQGYGKYPKKEGHFQGGDKGNTRENMAFIRSERSAFSRLNPDALPPGLDVVDERYVETPSSTVDSVTGELPPNGEFHEALPDEPPTDVEIPGADPEPEPQPEPEPEPEPPPEPAPKARAKAKSPEREAPRDETPVTHAQGKEIERLFSHDGAFDPASMGEFCNAQRNWGIRHIVDLKKWQYDIVVDCFSRGS